MHPIERTSGSGRIFRRVLAVVLIMGFVAAACGGTETPTATDATSAAAQDVAPEADMSPLSGEFAALDGTTVDLATLQGQDVVLWFWAPW